MSALFHSRALLLATFWAGVASAQAVVFSVRDLGPIRDLSGQTESGLKDINYAGTATGVNLIDGSYQAFLYSGAWTNLGTLGGPQSFAAGLNDSNQVVGYSVDSSGITRGFVWTPGGADGVPGNPQMKALGGWDQGTTQAYAINNQEQVTGYSDVVVKSKLEQHAFLWRNDAITDIGVLLGNLPNSFGYGINNSGHVAGTAYNSSYAAAHAFYYDGVFARDIGGLGGSSASALAINDAGQITGYAATTDGFDRAFCYTGGTMRNLGTLGGNYSYGLGINNAGVVVGGSFVDATDSIYHAFMWSNHVMRDLNALVDETGVGWVLVEARAISDSGQIVGSGSYRGAAHAFLLSPLSTMTPPRIIEARLSGSNMILKFTTVPNGLYSVQSVADPVVDLWKTSVEGIPGTGNTVEVAAPAPTQAARQLFRVRRTQ